MTTKLELLLASLLLTANLGSAQFSLDWWTIDGGGGTSTGGVYSISGTIGQPDAGVMSGGAYSLTGGFWSLVAAIQTPGAPTLNVMSTPTNTVVVTWPSPATGWLLQFSTDAAAAPGSWTVLPAPYAVDGSSRLYFVEPLPAGQKFYRLYRPE